MFDCFNKLDVEFKVFGTFNAFLLDVYPGKMSFTLSEAASALTLFTGMSEAVIIGTFLVRSNRPIFPPWRIREIAQQIIIYQESLKAPCIHTYAYRRTTKPASTSLSMEYPSFSEGSPDIVSGGRMNTRSPSPVKPCNPLLHISAAESHHSSGEQQAPPAPTRKICKQFHTLGRCNFGSRCLYHHIDPTPSEGVTLSVSAPTSQSSLAKEKAGSAETVLVSPLEGDDGAADCSMPSVSGESTRQPPPPPSSPRDLGIMNRCIEIQKSVTGNGESKTSA